MDTASIVEEYGFWALLTFIVIKDLVIPLANKYFPSLMRQREIEEEFKMSLQTRNTDAVEKIAETLAQTSELHAITNERLTVLESSHGRIMDLLIELTRGMEALLTEDALTKKGK